VREERGTKAQKRVGMTAPLMAGLAGQEVPPPRAGVPVHGLVPEVAVAGDVAGELQGTVPGYCGVVVVDG
jgi:hypothetical protein